ncbi:hypothetical protein P885DRAFT_64224 [Corynascus similis CBS 632.67]
MPNIHHVLLWDLHIPLTREPISGQAYFIRSKAEPHLYWFRQDDKICASTHARTAFRIQITPNHSSEADEKTALIATDRIHISLPSSQGTLVSRGEKSFLSFSAGDNDFHFGDLKGGFTTWDISTNGSTNWSENGDSSDPTKVQIRVLFSEKAGVEWELV